MALASATNPSAVHPHGRGDGALKLGQMAEDLRFTPTGVGTAYGIPILEVYQVRFTPTGVGTAPVSAVDVATRERFTPTGVGTA